MENWYAKGRQNKVIVAMDTGGASVVVLDGDKSQVIVDQVRPAARIPGRAELYIRKRGSQLIQIALPPGWTQPPDRGRGGDRNNGQFPDCVRTSGYRLPHRVNIAVFTDVGNCVRLP